MLGVFGFNFIALVFVLLASSVGVSRFHCISFLSRYISFASCQGLMVAVGGGAVDVRRIRFNFVALVLHLRTSCWRCRPGGVPGFRRISVQFRCIVFVPVVRVLWRCQRRGCDVRPILFQFRCTVFCSSGKSF